MSKLKSIVRKEKKNKIWIKIVSMNVKVSQNSQNMKNIDEIINTDSQISVVTKFIP